MQLFAILRSIKIHIFNPKCGFLKIPDFDFSKNWPKDSLPCTEQNKIKKVCFHASYGVVAKYAK